MSALDKQDNNLKDKVAEWLASEGYPLEFLTASVFQKNGFRVEQGYYVQDIQSNALREIDVLAEKTIDIGPSFLRVCYVVECKWSGDKPWVIFSSERHYMAPSACITQMIGSEAGQAILWSLAGDKLLQSLDVFSTPKCTGFNGRQAFTKSNDVFYNAMQSVTSAANALASEYDKGNRNPNDTIKWAVVNFPIIVLDGKLFEAIFDTQSGQILLKASDKVRIHWRGSETSGFPFTTIDIVTTDKLSDFVEARGKETPVMFERMVGCLKQLQDCVEKRSLEPLTISRGPRGVLGLPPLLAEIRALAKADKSQDNSTHSKS